MKHLTVLYDDGQANIQWIEDFEKEYNISLPKSYCDLMLKHNGVSFIQDTFNYLGQDNKFHISCIEFLPFGIPISGVASHIINYYQYSKYSELYEHKNVVPFGLNEFGYRICFDYRQDPLINDPPVVIMCHDQFMTNEQGQEKIAIFPIANSFDEFLDMLYEETE